MKRWISLGVFTIVGCSNAPIAGTLDTIFPSHVTPKKLPTRPIDDDRIPSPRLPDPELDRPPPDRNLPTLRPLDELPR